MTQLIASRLPRPNLSLRWRAAVALAFAGVAGVFLFVTPPGVLDKLDAVAYAICHRIGSHSFYLAGRELPLCARCTGIYLGAALTLIMLAASGRGRSSRLPPKPVLIVLLGFIGLMGIDGLNSYLGFFHGLVPQAYTPQNWLRLATGTLDGISMAAIVLPLFNATFWREPEPAASVRSARELAGLVVVCAAGSALVLTGWPALLAPIAVFSVGGLLALLIAINTTILLMLARLENRVAGRPAAAWALLAGLTATLVMIVVIDLVRFKLTGTWGGLPL